VASHRKLFCQPPTLLSAIVSNDPHQPAINSSPFARFNLHLPFKFIQRRLCRHLFAI
jgi:hypothetical protein